MDLRSSLCTSVCPLAQSTEVQKLSFTPTSLAVGSGYIAAGGQCSQVRVAQPLPVSPSQTAWADIRGRVILAAYFLLPLAARLAHLNVWKRNSITLAVPAVLLAVCALVRTPFRPGAVHDQENEAGSSPGRAVSAGRMPTCHCACTVIPFVVSRPGCACHYYACHCCHA